VSCRDWRRLLAHRFDPELPVPREWERAREHLAGCPSCRREAAAIDPTLAFQGAAAWPAGGEEVEAVRLAVRALRRTGRLRAGGAGARPGARRRMAFAAFFAALLAMLPAVVDRHAGELVRAAAVRSGGGERAAPRPAGPVASAIDGLDRPLARIYEWGAEDLSVVMVVDESLDV